MTETERGRGEDSLAPGEVASLVEAAGGRVQEVEQVIVLQVVEVRLDQLSARATHKQGNKVSHLSLVCIAVFVCLFVRLCVNFSLSLSSSLSA